jgi:hypothetical protein
VAAAVETVAGKCDVLAVRRENREGIKRTVKGDLLQSGSVHIDQEKVELAAFFAFVVAGEDDFLARRVPARGPVSLADIGHLLHIRSVGIGNEDFQCARLYQAFFQQVFVAFLVLGCRRTRGAPDQLLAVRGEEGSTIITQRIRNLRRIAAIDVHGPKFEVAAARRSEHDFGTVRRNGPFGIVTLCIGELTVEIALQVRDEDIIGVINGPDIFAINLALRRRWTGVCIQMCRGIQDFFVAGHEVSAGGAALASADTLGNCPNGSGCRHHENLIAFGIPFGKIALEGEHFTVEAEISFGVVATLGQSSHIFEVALAFIAQGIRNAVHIGGVLTFAISLFCGFVAACCQQGRHQNEERGGGFHQNFHFQNADIKCGAKLTKFMARQSQNVA